MGDLTAILTSKMADGLGHKMSYDRGLKYRDYKPIEHKEMSMIELPKL